MVKIMTTKEASKYLRLKEITIRKYSTQGEIPAIRIGSVWRFDKDVIDRWIGSVQKRIHKNDNKVWGDNRRGAGKKRLRKKNDSSVFVKPLIDLSLFYKT